MEPIPPITFKCSLCDYKCKNKLTIFKHKRVVHSVGKALIYHCEYCNYHILDLSNFNKHLLTKKHQKK
jgi:hypothetical protein